MLSTDPDHNEGGFLPGFGEDQDLRIRVLGPVVERVGGEMRLRLFGPKVGSNGFDKGKTKNGHAVLLMLEYDQVRILLGGDLNHPAEAFLLEHHTGLCAPAADANAEKRLVDAANPVFGCDVAKSCHHGSADFSDAFLAATDAAATVISSRDEESHAHPRSDTLGAIGLHGRGWRPLIFSTELMRSTREDEGDKRQQVGRLIERIEAASGEARDELVARRDALVDELASRNVTVYGAINLRTDGDKIVMSYKLEEPRTSSGGSPRRHRVGHLQAGAQRRRADHVPGAGGLKPAIPAKSESRRRDPRLPRSSWILAPQLQGGRIPSVETNVVKMLSS